MMNSLFGKSKVYALVGMVLITLRSTGIGYVLFMRGNPGAEKKQFQWIRDNVLIPFINWGRKECDGIDVESGAPMGDEHTAVS